MARLKPKAGMALIAQGGLSRSKSVSSISVGMRWNERSGVSGSSSSFGTTSVGSMARRPQYRVVMRVSSGAEATERRFFVTKRR